MNSEISQYVDNVVVIDTKSQYVYIGTVEEVSEEIITLKDVDVHDHQDYAKTKELYIMESRKYGVKMNRRRTRLMQREVVSISLLEDVIEY